MKEEGEEPFAVKTIVDEGMHPDKTGGQTDGAADGGFLPRYKKAFMGLSLIFGISGLFFWWRGRRLCRRMDKSDGRPTESLNID